MTNSTNNSNESRKLTDETLSDVSGGIISYSIKDLAKLLPEPTRSAVIKTGDFPRGSG